MALNAFIKIGSAPGEARQGKYGTEKWCEIQGWDWEVEAESSWTKGGGSSVGKPNPGKFSFEHYYDKASNQLLYYISSGEAFKEIKLEMCKGTGSSTAGAMQPFFLVKMYEAFITKVTNSATDDGNVLQKVELVFKKIEIDYRAQGENKDKPGDLAAPTHYEWDIPAGIPKL
jgi:type VI secretion system secreted protein Hcp